MSNNLWYQWRRNNWLVDPRRFVRRYRHVKIDRPIFLVGNQGGGLTLVSRMLRRHQQIISITGDHTYWAGADEMQKVMVLRLPPKLHLGDKYWGGDQPHPQFTPPRSWSYAADALVDSYHNTEADVSPADEVQLKFVIRETLYRYGRHKATPRFVDKSQVYTLKMRYMAALLQEHDPHFVLVTRNPYAACYRAALGKAGDMKRYAATMSLDERVEVCAQHWSNAMRIALTDKEQLPHFTMLRFEDILQNPRQALHELCQFLDLSFDERLVPQESDTIPFGSRRIDRWYPLRPNVNDRYLADLPHKYRDVIAARCQPLAEQLGYDLPD